ncbi:MAG: ABC-F family ATP-binding cassette domain-containing protein [Acidimicrobiales bacterium]
MPSPSVSPRLATLVAHSVTKFRGLAPILVDVELTVGPEHRIGIIGPNGVGKTTLLQILAGLDTPDDGRVALSPDTATVGYLAQEVEVSETEPLRARLGRLTGVFAAEKRLGDAAGALATGLPGAEEEYSVALERYLALGAGDFEARTAEILDGLELPLRLLEVTTTGLSGGQRAKASLAVLLLSRFDLLLLDEPTNDLDFDGLDRLEAYLRNRSGGLVVVSHDRAFLDRIVTSVVEIDESSHRAVLYSGGFATYLQARETARRQAAEAYESYLDERDRLRGRERQQRQWAVQGASRERRKPRDNDKAQRDFRINRTEKQASKVRITERALERLEVVERPHVPWRLDLDLASARRSGDVVARLEGAAVERGNWHLGPLDLELAWAERLAVLGANGSGKSTLIAALLGREVLSAGSVWVGPSVVIGEIGQGRERFVGTRTLIAEFLTATGATVPAGRSLLAKFGLTAAHVERQALSLSPGERTRAELALLMANGTNCLVLDEPTNHLDLPAIEQLEEALSAWQGTLVLVTHDRRLLETVTVTRRIELVDGQLSSDRST